MGGKFEIKSRIWICNKRGTFLGEGRVQLLREIEQTGSITKAAKNMNMSYKKAWELVTSMNKQCGIPVVERYVGGINGGGSILTEKGKELIRIFNEINEDCQKHLDKKIAELNF